MRIMPEHSVDASIKATFIPVPPSFVVTYRISDQRKRMINIIIAGWITTPFVGGFSDDENLLAANSG